MGEKIVLDTNILMNDPEKLLRDIDGEFIVSSIVVEELDHLKISDNKEKAFEARRGIRYLKNNRDKYDFILNGNIRSKEILEKNFDINKNDNKILDVCLQEKASIFSLDFNVILKAQSLGINTINKDIKENDNYKGYKEIQITDEELADLYSNTSINAYDLLENEYLIIKNENGEIVDKRKWTGTSLDPLKYKAVSTKYTDKVKPRNLKQEFAFDMLQDSKIKFSVLEGFHGSGKTLMMIANALELVEKGKYSKIIWVVQNEPVNNTGSIGALPGELESKLLPFTSIFADKVGGQFSMEELIDNRKLEIIPLAFIRGRSFKDAIVMMTEAENTTVQHMKLLISRLEEDSILMIDGDFKQTDKDIFKSNNGLRTVIEKLKGQSEFALMTLNDIERSKLANLASLLD